MVRASLTTTGSTALFSASGVRSAQTGLAQFPDLAALLKYLKLCVHSVLMDDARARRGGSLTSLDDVPESAPSSATVEHTVLGKLASEQLWQTIMRELEGGGRSRSLACISHLPATWKPLGDFFNAIPASVRERRGRLPNQNATSSSWLRRSAEVRAFLPI